MGKLGHVNPVVVEKLPLGVGIPRMHVGTWNRYVETQERRKKPINDLHPSLLAQTERDVRLAFQRSGFKALTIEEVYAYVAKTRNPHAHTKIAIIRSIHRLCEMKQVQVLICEEVVTAGMRYDYMEGEFNASPKRVLIKNATRFQWVQTTGGEMGRSRAAAIRKHGPLGWARDKMHRAKRARMKDITQSQTLQTDPVTLTSRLLGRKYNQL